MDYSAIVSAIIAVVGSMFGSFITQSKSSAIMGQKLEDMKDDVKKLSERVDAHNNFGLKIASIETKIENLEKEVRK